MKINKYILNQMFIELYDTQPHYINYFKIDNNIKEVFFDNEGNPSISLLEDEKYIISHSIPFEEYVKYANKFRENKLKRILNESV